jgi:uncharacterized OsmC-like protein
MQVTANYLGGTKFEAGTRGHWVVSDQPAENHGTDHGMTPPELLLSSLATCAAYYAAQYLNTRNLPASELKVTVSAEKETQPARLDRFRIDVYVPGLEERHQAGVLRAAKSCLIHATLLGMPSIETRFVAPAIPAGELAPV